MYRPAARMHAFRSPPRHAPRWTARSVVYRPEREEDEDDDLLMPDWEFSKEHEALKEQLPKTAWCDTLNVNQNDFSPVLVGSKTLEYLNAFYDHDWFKTENAKKVMKERWDVVATTKSALEILVAFRRQSKRDPTVKFEYKLDKVNDKQAYLHVTVWREETKDGKDGIGKQHVCITVVDTSRGPGGRRSGSSDMWLLIEANNAIDYTLLVHRCDKESIGLLKPPKGVYRPSTGYVKEVDLVRGPLEKAGAKIALINFLYAQRCVELSCFSPSVPSEGKEEGKESKDHDIAWNALIEMSHIRRVYKYSERVGPEEERKWGVSYLPNGLTVSQYSKDSFYRSKLAEELLKLPGTKQYIDQSSEGELEDERMNLLCKADAGTVDAVKTMSVSSVRKSIDQYVESQPNTSATKVVRFFQEKATYHERMFILDHLLECID